MIYSSSVFSTGRRFEILLLPPAARDSTTWKSLLNSAPRARVPRSHSPYSSPLVFKQPTWLSIRTSSHVRGYRLGFLSVLALLPEGPWLAVVSRAELRPVRVSAVGLDCCDRHSLTLRPHRLSVGSSQGGQVFSFPT